MIPGFSSALSGLQASQTRLDVSANNLANVNTNGFKSSRVDQTAGPTQEFRSPGASSPLGLYRGLGTQVSSTSTNFGQGGLIRTDYPSDLAINGSGFFEVVGPQGDTYFTRSGDFVRDAQGFLRTPEGAFLSGAGGMAVQIPNQATSYSIATDGLVTAQFADGSSTSVTQIDLAVFPNDNGLMNTGGGLYAPTQASGFPIYTAAGTNAAGTIQQGVLEASNVDMANEIVNQLLAQRSFEANARVISAGNEASKALLSIFDRN
jgi:flagellar basal-body rod protein FlgG